MSAKKNITLQVILVIAAALFAASFTAVFLINDYQNEYFGALGEFCQEVTERCPEAEQAVLSVVKEYEDRPLVLVKGYNGSKTVITGEENILSKYGYRPSDFLKLAGVYSVFYVSAGFLASIFLFIVALFFFHRREAMRIQVLTNYLERINHGDSGVLLSSGEDAFSGLQDEIYKTVTMLYQTRDEALAARRGFAENLYNIAHQLKTLLTSISLSMQMMCQSPSSKYMEQIDRQLARIMHLQEALLLLSRIDSGTLFLDKTEADVFTVLVLAADNLQELCAEAGVSIDIPEAGEAVICADMEWTMEAVMNLFKNCMEHTLPGGAVHCMYEQNLLYTRIQIWDDGSGFAKEDIPHLFERFYRGKNEKSNGIGIGLSLSRAIIESQNGTLTARNRPEGGACFEIRLYRH